MTVCNLRLYILATQSVEIFTERYLKSPFNLYVEIEFEGNEIFCVRHSVKYLCTVAWDVGSYYAINNNFLQDCFTLHMFYILILI